MKQEFFIRKCIAVGQKTKADSTAYGQGFNYWVEFGFPFGEGFDYKQARTTVETVLAEVDHKAIGVDLELGFEPTSPRLCAWLNRKLQGHAKGAQVRMLRGDGMNFESI